MAIKRESGSTGNKKPVAMATKSKGTTRQTTRKVSGTNAYGNQATQRKQALKNMTPAQRKKNEQLAKVGKNVIYPLATSAIPGGLAVKGAGAVAKGAVVAGKAASKGIKTYKANRYTKLKARDAAVEKAAKIYDQTKKAKEAEKAAEAAKKARAVQVKESAKKYDAQEAAKKAKEARIAANKAYESPAQARARRAAEQKKADFDRRMAAARARDAARNNARDAEISNAKRLAAVKAKNAANKAKSKNIGKK